MSFDADPGPEPLPELSGTERDLLVCCSGREPMSGMEILETVCTAYDDATAVKSSTLYPQLERLVGRGYLSKRQRPDDGRTNEYALTDAGRRRALAYRRWVVERVPPKDPPGIGD